MSDTEQVTAPSFRRLGWHSLRRWQGIAHLRKESLAGNAAMESLLRQIRFYELALLCLFLVVGAVEVFIAQRDAAEVAVATEQAATAQTELATLWELAALDPRAPEDDGARFVAALDSLTIYQTALENAARSAEAPLPLRELMGGRSYTLSARIADLVALGHRIAKPTAADDADALLADLRHEIAGAVAPRAEQTSRLFHEWGISRAVRHSRTIAWAGGTILGVAFLALLALLPFELHLRRSVTLLEWLAARDALTGALSRGAFLARLSRMLIKARPARGVGLIRFDLDDFRELNAKHGDEAGDAALLAVSRRLRDAAGETALVGRLGSDGFAVALPGILGGHTALTNEATRLLREVAQPLTFGTQSLHIAASAGYALAPQDALQRSELMRLADIALRDAKQAGKGRAQGFRAVESLVQARREAVVSALANDDLRGLEPWLQPIISCVDGMPVRFEVLARWHHPVVGQIPPSEFLPIAEALGKLPRVSATVRDAAFVSLALMDTALGRTGVKCGLSINLSAVEMTMPQVLPSMEASLDAAGLDLSRLSIELAENVLAGGGEAAALKSLQDMRLRGAQLYLDNFGTGFASLSNLHTFALDALKIARPFVDGIGRSARAEAIVRGVIGLAHGLGIQAVAEGVETAEELDFVRNAGCDLAQGFFIAPPMSVGAAIAWLRETSTRIRAQ